MTMMHRAIFVLVAALFVGLLAACDTNVPTTQPTSEVIFLEDAGTIPPIPTAEALRATQTPTPTALPTRTPQPTPRQVTVSRIREDIDPRQVTPMAPGAQLPDLVLTDINGNAIDLRALDRPLVLNFWSVGCGSCFYEFPVLQSFYAHHGADALAMVGINIADFPEETRIIAEQMGAEFPQVVDANADFFATYFNGAVIPTTIFVDADGRISTVMTGPMDVYNIDLQLQALGLPAREDE